MFYLTRRQARAAMAATAGAAAYLAVSEIGARKVRLSGLWVLSSVALAGMAAHTSNAKAASAHKRIDVLVPAVAGVVSDVAGKYDKSGGTISGSVTVTGDHVVNADQHVHGTLYGFGGDMYLGDFTTVSGHSLAADVSITAGSNLNAGGQVNASSRVDGSNIANAASTATMYNTTAGTFGGLDGVCNDIATKLNHVINSL